MLGLSKTWTMDPQLRGDTMDVFTHGECRVVLMNDARWPWLIVVPMIVGAEELHDLSPPRSDAVMQLALHLGRRLKDFSGCDKINVAAIGNSVRQLHIHVVARNDGDPNWPKPIWGFETAQPYDPDTARELVTELKDVLHVPFLS